jgi:glycosyltransferase involved in cell wall biosynthesis
MLGSGKYRHVLVHFLDADMWEVLGDSINDIKVTVWVHGADIQPWYRRKFNIETPEQEKVAKEKSEERMAFWRGILSPMHKNLQLVFVSNYLAEEVMEDLGFRLPDGQYHIIHNPINTDLFSYQEKDPELRKKILSIRPYASRAYANDLTVKCILDLSKESFFGELEFRIVGDGKLFDETVEPIRNFDNIIIEKKFLSQQEIAELHKQYGIFLCPSRMDTQGVSRDEAMSSGLIPVTTNAGAIPEFVNGENGFVVTQESHSELAKAVKTLYADSRLFVSLSQISSESARAKSGYKITVPKEIKLLLE